MSNIEFTIIQPKILCSFEQPESDGSRSGSSLSLRILTGPDAIQAPGSQVQSPTHRRVHRSISATSTNPSRRASSGGETLRESRQRRLLETFTDFNLIRIWASGTSNNNSQWNDTWNNININYCSY